MKHIYWKTKNRGKVSGQRVIMSKMKSRVISGVGANIFGQGINVGIQLLSLPIFLYFWSMTQYGEWLMLSAIPVFLSLADVGMVTVAMNKMTMLMGNDKPIEANEVFQSALLMMSIVLTAMIGIAALIIPHINSELLFSVDSKDALFLLIVVAMGNLFSGLFDAVFRASGRYALGIYYLNLARIVEWIGSIVGLLAIGTFSAVAFGFFIGRMLASLLLLAYCRLRFAHFQWGFKYAKADELRFMIRPALSLMLFPISNAISIQGMTLLVGNVYGTPVVAIFNVYRTISRIVVQLVGTYSHALSPEFSKFHGANQITTSRSLYRQSMVVSEIAIIISAVLLYFMFPWILDAWTNGKVNFEADLALLFIAYTVMSSLWHIPRILVLSTNRHESVSVVSFLVSILCFGIAWLMAGLWGVGVVVVALITQESVMFLFSSYVAHRQLRQ